MIEGDIIAKKKDIAAGIPIHVPLFKNTEKPESSSDEIVFISPDKILDFPDHPFKSRIEQETNDLIESISKYGQFDAAHVRLCPDKEGYYEAITGHRRREACLSNNMDVKCIIHHDMTDDEAIIMMIDSNLKQRENIPISERALAYKMMFDALKRQGARHDLTSRHGVEKLKTTDLMAKKAGTSSRTIERHIRFTHLIPEFLGLLDNGRMQQKPAYELSFLSQEQQWQLNKIMEMDIVMPSHAQAKELRRISESDDLSYEQIHAVMREEKGNQKPKHVLKSDFLRAYFSEDSTPDEIDSKIAVSMTFTQKCEKLLPENATPEDAERVAEALIQIKEWHDKNVQKKKQINEMNI